MKSLNAFFDGLGIRRDVWLDCVRIYLGLGLFVRGLALFSDTQGTALIESLSTAGRPWLLSAALLHYVALAHFCGGLALALGLLTRAAALIQIPILAGAVFFVHRGQGLFSLGQSLEFSALVLFLLVILFLAGPGRLSLDRVIFGPETPSRNPEARTRSPETRVPNRGGSTCG